MKKNDIQQIAAQYLVSRSISFVPNGEVMPLNSKQSEVVFLVPEALDPKVIVDPPDVRVIVDHESQCCELVVQM